MQFEKPRSHLHKCNYCKRVTSKCESIQHKHCNCNCKETFWSLPYDCNTYQLTSMLTITIVGLHCVLKLLVYRLVHTCTVNVIITITMLVWTSLKWQQISQFGSKCTLAGKIQYQLAYKQLWWTIKNRNVNFS